MDRLGICATLTLLMAACAAGTHGLSDGGTAGDAVDGQVGAAAFTTEIVAPDTRASDVRLAISSAGVAAIAFREDVEGTVPCAETVPSGDAPATAIRVALEDAAWAIDDVATVGPGGGLDVLWEANDVLVLYRGGASGARVCAPSDLVLARRSAAYAEQVLVASSADAPSAVPYSTDGDVVGDFPAAGLLDGELVVAYGDTHFGYTRDDFERADLEVFRSGAAEVVDAATGAGVANALALGTEGEIAVAFANLSGSGGDQFGVWLATLAGATWALSRAMATDPDTSIGVAFDGPTPVVAFFDGDEQDLVVARPDGASFTSERVDRRFTTGLYADLASDGARLAASFYYCGRGGRTNCGTDEDALRWAVLEGGQWRVEEVDAGGDEERCGMHTAIGFRPDGKAAIAYVCHAVGSATGRVMLAEEK